MSRAEQTEEKLTIYKTKYISLSGVGAPEGLF